MNDTCTAVELSDNEYELFRKLVYSYSGINLGSEKQHLVRARLGKQLRKGDFKSFRDYYNHVMNDKTGKEMSTVIDAISTNTTHFYRENRHFDLLGQTLEQQSAAGNLPSEVRIWSAACSSGEEPYSIAMTVHNILKRYPRAQLKLLATDLSMNILSKAKLGIYETIRLGTLPDGFARTYFRPIGDRKYRQVQVVPEIRKSVTFARFNLIQEKFAFRHQFDAIFCRNVMIYFDRPTQERLINRFHKHLKPGGLLMVGHSESLNALQHPYSYVEPATYRK